MKFKSKYLPRKIPLIFLKHIVASADLNLLQVQKKDIKFQNLTNCYDFTVQQKYLLIRNNYEYEDLSQMENLKSLENSYEAFRYFLEVVVLLDLQINC